MATGIAGGRPCICVGAAITAPHIFLRLSGKTHRLYTLRKGDMMKKGFIKKAARPILIIVIIGFALTVLISCGLGHGHNRHGYNGRNNYNNSDHSWCNYDHSDHDPTYQK